MNIGLIAMWGAYLGRLCGEEEVVVSQPSTLRHDERLAETVGYFHTVLPLLASTTVASKVGPNGWGEKPDADGSVDHYSNTLGEVPEWVFTGSGDHDWKDYDTVQNQEWYENTYPSGESGM